MKKIVLTGGPCAGKTTVCNKLREMGYAVIDETAIAIAQEIGEKLGHSGRESFMSQFVLDFQNMVIDRQLEKERNLPQNTLDNLLFLDRSILDGHGYIYHRGGKPNEWQMKAFETHDYDHIFVFDTLNNFDPRKGSGRSTETREMSLSIKEKLIQSYSDFGYEINHIEVDTVENRISKIFSLI